MRGFTLIELLVVVAVVAILGALAYPSYQDSVRRSRRSDAMDATAAVMQAQERWRANNPSYTNNLAADLSLGTASKGGYYTLSVTGASATGYTLTATAAAGRSQAQDTGCTVLTLTILNGATTAAQPNCWTR